MFFFKKQKIKNKDKDEEKTVVLVVLWSELWGEDLLSSSADHSYGLVS